MRREKNRLITNWDANHVTYNGRQNCWNTCCSHSPCTMLNPPCSFTFSRHHQHCMLGRLEVWDVRGYNILHSKKTRFSHVKINARTVKSIYSIFVSVSQLLLTDINPISFMLSEFLVPEDEWHI